MKNVLQFVRKSTNEEDESKHFCKLTYEGISGLSLDRGGGEVEEEAGRRKDGRGGRGGRGGGGFLLFS